MESIVYYYSFELTLVDDEGTCVRAQCVVQWHYHHGVAVSPLFYQHPLGAVLTATVNFIN
jgi:hypothetical protein